MESCSVKEVKKKSHHYIEGSFFRFIAKKAPGVLFLKKLGILEDAHGNVVTELLRKLGEVNFFYCILLPSVM